MIKINTILLLIIFIISCANKPRVRDGKVTKGVYNNPYLGLSLIIPEGWVKMSDTTINLLNRVEKNFLANEDPRLMAAIDTEIPNHFDLLGVSKYPYGTPVASNSLIRIKAFRFPGMPGMETGKDLIQNGLIIVESFDVSGNEVGNIQEEIVKGNLWYKIKSSNLIFNKYIHQISYVKKINDVFVTIMATYITEEDKEIISKAFSSLEILNYKDPKHLYSLNRAKSDMENKRYKSAIANCDSALHFKPNFSEAQLIKGKAFFSLDSFNLALEFFDEVIKIDSVNDEAFVSKAIVYLEQKDTLSFQKNIDIAIKINEKNTTALWFKLNDYLNNGKHKEADELNDKLIKHEYESPLHYLNGIELKMVLGYYEQMSLYIQKANALNLKTDLQVIVYYFKCMLDYLKGNDPKESEKDFYDALKLGPKTPWNFDLIHAWLDSLKVNDDTRVFINDLTILFEKFQLSPEDYIAELPISANSEKIHLRVIGAPSEKKAQELKEKIKNENQFIKIANEKAPITSKKDGGDLGYLNLEDLSIELKKEIKKLKIGDITPPIKKEDIYYLFMKVD